MQSAIKPAGMRAVRAFAAFALLGFLGACAPMAPSPVQSADPLASWNAGANKERIVAFVRATTTEGGKDYVPAAERIAVFDNDGTLWSEQPIYFQVAFVFDRIKVLAPQHPEWKEKEPFKSFLAGDMKAVMASGERGLFEMLLAAQSGVSVEEFQGIVRDWLASARHPKFKRPYGELTFQPMQELMRYLRANGFRTFIVSGGTVEFMRAFAQPIYGVPPEQVIGSRQKLAYEVRNGQPAIVMLPQLEFINDKEGKPVGIETAIGRQPIAAFGNSDGDLQMLEWTLAGKGQRLAMIVHHDDATREFAYDRDSSVGRLARGLDEAAARGWSIISIKGDWAEVYAPAK